MLRSLNRIACRMYSEAPPVFPKLTFADVQKKLKESSKTLLLDVREKSELTSDGRIAEAVNVPLGDIQKAFQEENAKFQKLYGFKKPESSEEIMIHCKAGIRAMKAAVILNQAGYSNLKVYDGILDWVSNGGPVVK